MKTPVYITGITVDRKLCYGGIFTMADTYGFPVADSILAADSHNAVVSWPTFVKDAIKAGWSFEKATQRIRAAFKELWRAIPDGVNKLTPSRCDGFGEPLDPKEIPRLVRLADMLVAKGGNE